MGLNIVTGFNTIIFFKRSNFFRQNLGLSATTELNDRRILNKKDKFAYYYNIQYKTTIYGQGNIGDIKFYIDHYIKDDSIGVYYGDNFEEFVFKLDKNMIKEKGIDFYLGFLLKEIDMLNEDRVKNNELKKLESERNGDPDMVFKNPGSVTYADLKAYLEKKQKERY